jgi:hypothetical protein
MTGSPLPEIANSLRNFFLEHFPQVEESLSEIFQVSTVICPNVQKKFLNISKEMHLPEMLSGSHPDDVMTTLEITLYKEWGELFSRMKKEFLAPGLNLAELKRKATFKRQIMMVREVVLLVILGGVAIMGIKFFNQWYEKRLTDSISIYEPRFAWLDRTLVFKEREESERAAFSVEVKDIDEVDDSQNLLGDSGEEVRYDVESDVVVTSWDSLPRDFDTAGLERSDYEEQGVSGYRDSRYGNTKVYRVLMRSQDTLRSKSVLNRLISQYSVTQVDNVRPGMAVPGGIYYNLYVPREYLKEFVAQVMDVGESVLYESQTQSRRNPAGQNKVFIWVKSI